MHSSLRTVVQRVAVERKFLAVPVRFATAEAIQRDRMDEKKYRVSEKPTVIVFPGQGAQFVGMGAQLLKYAEAKRIFERANATLGFDLLKTCLSGTEKEIQSTRICQLAVCVTSLAAIERLKAEHPEVS